MNNYLIKCLMLRLSLCGVQAVRYNAASVSINTITLLPPFTPQLDSRLRAEFLDHSAHLLPVAPQIDWARLLTRAWDFTLEPPRDGDLPVLPPKAYPHIDRQAVELLQRALQPPAAPPAFIGRKAERDRTISALINGQAVIVRAEAGTEKRAFLRQIAADSRVRGHFRRIWWFNTAESIGAAIGMALELPHLLKASPDEQPALAREFLQAGSILLIISTMPDDATIDRLLEFGTGILIATHAQQDSTENPTQDFVSSAKTPFATVRLGELPASDAAQIAGFSDPPGKAESALIGRVNGNPRALSLIKGLMAHDGLTLTEIDGLIGAQPDSQPLDDLLAASWAALPVEYQAIGGWFREARSLPVALGDFNARFPSPLAARRALRTLIDHGFIAVEGETIRAIGWPQTDSSAIGSDAPLQPIHLPISDYREQDDDSLPGDDPRRAARHLYQDGIAAIDARKDDDAEALLEEALLLRQRHDHAHAAAETHVALARLAYLRGDDTKAIRHLESAAELIHALRDSESLDVVRVALSRVYRRSGRLDAALSLLGDDAPGADLFAIYVLRGEWDEAYAVAERDSNPRDRRWQTGYARLGANQPDAALDIAGNHEDYEACLIRALAAHQKGELARALTAYERADAAAGPNADRGLLARAWACALAEAGRFAEAEIQVSAAGVWYESRLGRPIFARQQISHTLHAIFALAQSNFDTAEKVARRALACPGELPHPAARAAAYHVLGRIAAQHNDPKAALNAYQNALKERESIPNRDETAIGLTLCAIAACHAELNELDRAVANYRRALTHLSEDSEQAARLNTLLALRSALEQIGRAADALAAGSQAIVAADQLARIRPAETLRAVGYTLSSQAQALIDAGRPTQADQTLNVWLTRLAQQIDLAITADDPTLQGLGSALLIRSTLDNSPRTSAFTPRFLYDLAEEAVRITEVHWPETPVNWAARRDLGELLLNQGSAAEAFEILMPLLASPIVEATPLSALRAAIGAGRAAIAMNQPIDAIPPLEQAIALEPDLITRGGLIRELAGAYEAAGDLAGAANAYTEALKQFDVQTARAEHVAILIDLGYIRLRMEQFSPAIDTFESALTIVQELPDPALMSQVLSDLANAHYTLGQYKRAAATYRRTLDYQTGGDLSAARAGTLVALAQTHTALGEHMQALTAYHDALHVGPAPDIRHMAQIGVAGAYVALGQRRQAIDAYSAALRLETLTAADRGLIERGLGQQYAALGQHDAARKHFEKALQGVEDDQSGLTLRAIAEGYLAQGQIHEAIEVYRQAIEHLERARFPIERAAVHRTLGELYLKANRADEALPFYEGALDIERGLSKQDGGRIVATLRGLADVHEQRKDFDKAILAYHQALVYQDVRHAPEQYTQTLYALGRLYSQVRRYGEAAKALEDALVTEYGQHTPDKAVIAAAMAQLGDVYRVQGKAIQAAELYRQIAAAAQPVPVKVQAEAQPAAEPDSPDPLHDRARQALSEVEGEITRYRQMLQAVDQSWSVLSRERKPDLKSLALLRALQAQIHAALGEAEVSRQRIDQLFQLLDSRRADLQGQSLPVELQALAWLLAGYEHHRHGNTEKSVDSYRKAMIIAESRKLAPELTWVIQTQIDNLAG